MKYIYMLTEKNVDGNGSESSEFVSSSRQLTQKELQELQECLDTAKTDAEDSPFEMNNHDKITDAVRRFKERTGRQLESANDFLECELTF